MSSICALCLAVMPAAAQELAPHAPPDVPVLAFAWDVPCSATVEETAFNQGVTTVVRYRIDARRHAGGDIIVEQSQMELLEFNGEDPRVALGVMHGPVLAMASNAPAMQIGSDGRFIDVVDLGATIDRMVELLLRDLTVLDPAMVREMIAAARTPTVMKLTVDATRARWNDWVGHWVGIPLELEGWSYEEPRNDIEGLTTLRSSALVERLPPPASDLTRLRLTTVWEGAFDVAGDGDTQTDAQGLVVPASDRGELPGGPSMEITRVVEASFDPASLRPARVTTRTETAVHRGPDTRRDAQRHEYRFTWHDPAGADASP